MDGINVLNVYEYVTNDGTLMGVLFIVTIILAIVSFGLALVGGVKGNGGCTYGFAFVVCLIFCTILLVNGFDTRTETRYEVTIDEDVEFKTFTEKYDVIEQRGQIYVIRERK